MALTLDDVHRIAHLARIEIDAAAAREAHAKRLILTHLWPFIDREAVLAEGAEAFGDSVTLAAQHLVTTI